MHEAMSMDLAVEQALKMTNREDTLIIVTADHGHTMEMSGYQSRGSDIRGTNILLIGLLKQYSKMIAVCNDSKDERILSNSWD